VDEDALAELRRQWERSELTTWDLEDLPESVSVTPPGKGPLRVYPALVAADDGRSADLKLFTDRHAGETAHPKGVQALLMNRFNKDLKHLRQQLCLGPPANNYAGYFGGQKALENQLYEAVCRRTFCRNLRTRSLFDAAVAELARKGVHQLGRDLVEATANLLTAYHEIRTTLHRLETQHPSGPLAGFLSGLRQALEGLVPANFIALYDTARLNSLVRYLQALTIRAQRGVIDLPKDQARTTQLSPFVERFNAIVAGLDAHASSAKRRAVEELLWMIEEYKISVYAQEVGTAFPVSAKRLRKQIEAIELMI
jgi:ATP-dependent helicase HrpA